MAYCLPVCVAQELPPVAVAPVETDPIDTQLRVNKTTLLENKSDKSRIDAAALLLFSDNPAAREILLDVLKRTDNPGARAAVCEVLNPARAWQRPVKNKEDFIKPLIGVLTSEPDFTIAKLAAEATLIFGYGEVQLELEKALADPSLPLSAKINVIYTLKRHPDKQAVAGLISLLDSPEPQIVEAARNALVSVGIAVSPDAEIRKQMFAELQQRGAEVFLRERLVRQETRMREMEADLATWQQRYRTTLSRLYDSLTDDVAKSAFLAEHLSAQETTMRVWALDKLNELRIGTTKLKLSDQLQAVLLGLISDPNRQVRSKTARLLASMRELNAAKPLLDQLKVEQDDVVRREVFVALGEACYFASLPTAGHKVPEEVRKETLDWAVRFLDEPDAEKSRSGADVIGKLLEQNGLKPDEVEGYLKALVKRYGQAGIAADHGLRSYLLGTMAGLCATRSTCRVSAAKLYGGLFEEALGGTVDAVRQAAVDGLVNIDKPIALRKLPENMISDPSPIIRVKVIDLAGDTGGAQDLDWLVKKLGVAGEGEPAWQAMLKIFRRSNVTVLVDWMARIAAPAMTGRLSADQEISFLTVVEQKAQSEGNVSLLKSVQESLVQSYISHNNLKQAADYLTGLFNAAASDKEKQQLRSRLLSVYLASSSIDQAGELVGNCLSEKNLDLSSEGFVIKAVEEYLANSAGADPNALLKTLEQIKVKDPNVAQMWRAVLSRWVERFAKAKKAEGAEKINN
jgi:HEAT repeat protein